MKTRTYLVGTLLVGGGLALSRLLGSTPEPGSDASPLPSVSANPNAFASAPLHLAASPDRVRELALVTLQQDLTPLLGIAESIEATPLGLDAVIQLGPFRDDLSIAVLPDPGSASGTEGSVVWARSVSRVGRSDLGVNRIRTRRLLDALADRVQAADAQP